MFTEAFPILTTRDLSKALPFWRDLLGFAQTYQFPADGPPVYVGLRLGASSDLGLAEDNTAAPGSRRFEMCVYADDCDAAVERLRVHGVPVLAEPADQPWGERMARVADPDGNPVMILTRL